MPHCRSNFHTGSRFFPAARRGQPPAFCPECDRRWIVRRNVEWNPREFWCVVCGMSMRGSRLGRRTCSGACRFRLRRLLERVGR
ncbi:MAG: hypothetical protein OXI10_12075 [Gammaproteobacteria bacterium]|nr:hypothetical protein [Gammaproteobacteria bacterium]